MSVDVGRVDQLPESLKFVAELLQVELAALSSCTSASELMDPASMSEVLRMWHEVIALMSRPAGVL